MKVKNSLHLSFNKRVLNIHLSMNRKFVMVIVLYFIQQHRTKHSPFESSSYNIVNVSNMFVQEVAVLLTKHLSFIFFHHYVLLNTQIDTNFGNKCHYG